MLELLKTIMRLISPQIRTAICEGLNDLERKAAETPNPFDDVVVFTLKKILACDKVRA